MLGPRVGPYSPVCLFLFVFWGGSGRQRSRFNQPKKGSPLISRLLVGLEWHVSWGSYMVPEYGCLKGTPFTPVIYCTQGFRVVGV